MSEPLFSVEVLARALYETDTGSDGYRPMHESIPWDKVTWRDYYLERAREIITKIKVTS